MLPQRILSATDGSEPAARAAEAAFHLARRFSAAVGLAYVVNIRQLEGPFLADLSGMVGVSPFLNFQKGVRDLLFHKGEAALEGLAARGRELGLAVDKHLEEGVVGRVICRLARSYDLVCLGRHGEHADWSGLLMGATVEEVIRGSSRPVLVAPGDYRPTGRLLVPYDGSRPASAALALAVEMAGHLQAALTVLAVFPEEAEGERLLAEAREYAGPRPVAVETIRRPGDPADAILETVAERDAEMVVMGAYGHSRLRELFLGSTTDAVLRGAKVPVLLYR